MKYHSISSKLAKVDMSDDYGQNAYADILTQYHNDVNRLINMKQTDVTGPWSYLEELAFYEDDLTMDDFGYAIVDLNQNGSPELILLTTQATNTVSVFSLRDEEPYLLKECWLRNSCSIREYGLIVSMESAGAANNRTAAYELDDNDRLILIEEYGWEEKQGSGYDALPMQFRGFGGERQYYAEEDASFIHEFVIEIPTEEYEFEFIPISQIE